MKIAQWSTNSSSSCGRLLWWRWRWQSLVLFRLREAIMYHTSFRWLPKKKRVAWYRRRKPPVALGISFAGRRRRRLLSRRIFFFFFFFFFVCSTWRSLWGGCGLILKKEIERRFFKEFCCSSSFCAVRLMDGPRIASDGRFIAIKRRTFKRLASNGGRSGMHNGVRLFKKGERICRPPARSADLFS